MPQGELRNANLNYRYVWHFLDALVRAGLTRACVSPGYLNAPLLLLAAEHPGIETHVFHDERAAAFAGVGMARACGEPVAVLATAGTASAELHAAVVEAWQSRIPVLLLTADRPHELRDVGERQSVDQVRVFGHATKWYHEAALPVAGIDLRGYVRALALRAWSEAQELPRGPVHVNLPFREPLPPTGERAVEGATAGAAADDMPARVAEFFGADLAPSPAALEAAAALVSGRRALVVVGELHERADALDVLALATRGGFPVFADPLSQLRAGGHDRDGLFYLFESSVGAVGGGRVVEQALGVDDAEAPEVVIRFGAPPVAKAINAWMAARPAVPQIVVDDGRWRDPSALATTVIRGAPGRVARALAARLAAPAPAAWTERWRAGLRARTERMARVLQAEVPFPSEPGVVLALAAAMPAGSALVVGASMPIRDVDAFFPLVSREVTIVSNRGASGIDGLVATAIGTALADRGRPTYLLAGDLSVLHDLGSLRAAALHRAPLHIVVLNNDGGGIFHFVPQVNYPHFETHVATAHGTRFVPVAEALGIPSLHAQSRDAFVAWAAHPGAGPRLAEVTTDRAENARLHERLWAALAA